ncbi:MAG TPA: PQQ-binding-like beta-propeller repeat protein [Candidatus Baltobacteraceae bacterium]|nr:PQQ-binding-like beta-propeller repeat protein [Candidatus Baltobacteraceae bacterium]
MRTRRWPGAAAGVAAITCAAAIAFAATSNDWRAPKAWTQFRLYGTSNAVLRGSLSVSWRTVTGAPYSSSPTADDRALYIGDNAGVLRAFDITNGKVLWSAQVAKPLMSAPLLAAGLVIAGEGDESSPGNATPSHPIHVGAGESALLAFDRRTGALRWRIPLPGSGMPTPAIMGNILVQHNGAGSLYGVDVPTGRVIYVKALHSIASMTAATPVSKYQFVTLGVDSNAVWLLDARTGATIARTDFAPNASGFGDCPPAYDGKAIYCNYALPPYGSVPQQTDRFAVERAFAVDPRAGKRLWDVYLERGSLPRRNEAAIPMLAYGMLYCGSSVAPYVHALDPATGALKWRKQVRGNVLGGIAAQGGAIYFGDLGGYLWALDAKTGAVIGDVYEGTPFNVGSPIIVGRTLVIGSRGGALIAVPLSHIRSSRD